MKTYRIIILLGMLVLTLPVLHAQNIDYLGKAKEFLAQGDCERARYAYEDYKKTHPGGDAEVEMRIAECGKDTYIDLGLRSGTLWKNNNESGLYYQFEAVKMFGDNLPTKEQFEELMNSCVWERMVNGYKVTGPNGNFIVLPEEGYYNPLIGSLELDGGGRYWCSTLSGRSQLGNYAWCLYFFDDKLGMSNVDLTSFKDSIRLVSKK